MAKSVAPGGFLPSTPAVSVWCENSIAANHKHRRQARIVGRTDRRDLVQMCQPSLSTNRKSKYYLAGTAPEDDDKWPKDKHTRLCPLCQCYGSCYLVPTISFVWVWTVQGLSGKFSLPGGGRGVKINTTMLLQLGWEGRKMRWTDGRRRYRERAWEILIELGMYGGKTGGVFGVGVYLYQLVFRWRWRNTQDVEEMCLRRVQEDFATCVWRRPTTPVNTAIMNRTQVFGMGCDQIELGYEASSCCCCFCCTGSDDYDVVENLLPLGRSFLLPATLLGSD